MNNIVDLEDFDDDEFDNSSWGGHSHQDAVSETLSARNHDEEDEQLKAKKNDHVVQQEYNPHESEEMDPMMFGSVEHNEDSFENFNHENFEESNHNQEQAQEDKPIIRTIDDYDNSDDGFEDFSDISEDEEEEQTNSFRIVKKTESPEQKETPITTAIEEKTVSESYESTESETQFKKNYRTLDDYDGYSDDESAQEDLNKGDELEEVNVENSISQQESPKNTYFNEPYSQSVRSDSYRNLGKQLTQKEENLAKTLPPKINYKEPETRKEIPSSSTTSTLQNSSQQYTFQSATSNPSHEQHQHDQYSTITSQKETLQPILSSTQQLTHQTNQSQSTLQKQTSTLQFTLPSTRSLKSEDEDDDFDNYNPIQSIKVSPKTKAPKNVTIENIVIEDNRSDKSSSSTKSNPIVSQPTTKENLEKVFFSLKSKEDFKVRESEITYPKRSERKKEERILKDDCIFYPVKENQSKYISLEEIAKRNNTLRRFNMETIMSETLSKKTSKRHVDLRDEKILQLVLDLYFNNGLIQKMETSKVRRIFSDERRPRVAERNVESSHNRPSVIHSKSSKKVSEPQMLSLHFSEEGSLSQVLESYLLEYLEKNKRNLKSNLIFIVFNELVSILNTISLYFYTELTDRNNLAIPSFAYRGPVMPSHLFENLMACFPFTRISNSKYTLESWISINHISEIIFTLQRIIKSRFWNLDHRPNCDNTHLKLDLGLNVFDLYLPKQMNNNQKLSKQILETPLNEIKYLQTKQEMEREEEYEVKKSGSFLDNFKNNILFEKNKNGKERNLFSKYHQPLVDSCVNEVLNEVFGDTLIIQSIRERIFEKINKL